MNMMSDHKFEETNFLPLALVTLVDRYDRPISVAVALSDWEKLRPSLHPNSPLYQHMQQLCLETPDSHVPYVYSQNPDEEEIQQKELVYKNELCTEPDIFVRETARRLELIRVHSGAETYGLIERLD